MSKKLESIVYAVAVVLICVAAVAGKACYASHVYGVKGEGRT